MFLIYVNHLTFRYLLSKSEQNGNQNTIDRLVSVNKSNLYVSLRVFKACAKMEL